MISRLWKSYCCIFFAAAIIAIPQCAKAQDDYSTNFVTHGPLLGKPEAHRMRVWARTERAGSFVVKYGTSEAVLDQTSATATTIADHDYTGWVSLEDLKAGTTYHYQVFVNDLASGPPGCFRTLPDPADYQNAEHNPRGLFNYRFQFGSCANQNPKNGIGPSLPTFATMQRELQDKVSFSIMNGDFIYEEHRSMPVTDWSAQVGLTPAQTPVVVNLAPTVVGVWQNYKSYLSRGVNLSTWAAQHAHGLHL